MSGRVMRVSVLGLTGAAALMLAACDNGPSAVQTRDRAEGAGAVLTAAALGGPAYGGSGAGSGSTAAGPETGGGARGEQGAVTANRSETANAKITRLYERNGAAFGARSAEDYAARMKGFADSPPAGADTVRRPNGDTLYYEASTNTFAVISRDGTPRTMFKPDEGPAYWAQQKARAPTFGQRRSQGSE